MIPGDPVVPWHGDYWMPAFAGMTSLFSLAVGGPLSKQRHFAGDRSALSLEVIGHRAAERRVPNPMDAVGRHRTIAAGEFVRALRTGLDPRELLRNGKVDG